MHTILFSNGSTLQGQGQEQEQQEYEKVEEEEDKKKKKKKNKLQRQARTTTRRITCSTSHIEAKLKYTLSSLMMISLISLCFDVMFT